MKTEISNEVSQKSCWKFQWSFHCNFPNPKWSQMKKVILDDPDKRDETTQDAFLSFKPPFWGVTDGGQKGPHWIPRESGSILDLGSSEIKWASNPVTLHYYVFTKKNHSCLLFFPPVLHGQKYATHASSSSTNSLSSYYDFMQSRCGVDNKFRSCFNIFSHRRCSHGICCE